MSEHELILGAIAGAVLLVARGLITELFHDPETGAINYGTTDALLVNLGINSLDELPHISPLLDDGADGFAGESIR